MISHVYHTRNEPLSTIEENASSKANFEASESSVISETANLVLDLVKKFISRFDGLDKEILNLRRNHQNPPRRKSTPQEES